MRKILVISLLLLVLFINSVQAQSPTPTGTPQIYQSTTFPSLPSLDRPFIWVITTPSLTEPARVTWQTAGSPVGAGSFKKISDTKWVCFFSTDPSSICGPSPFTGTGGTTRDYRVVIRAANVNNGDPSFTSMAISQLPQLEQVVYDISSNIAYMPGSGFTGTSASVSYTLLSAADLTQIKTGSATYSAEAGRFVASFKDSPPATGKYFILFELTRLTDGKKAGSVGYFEIAGALIPTPGGITTKQNTLDVDQVAIDAKVNKSEPVEATFKIRNPTTDIITNLTAALPSYIIAIAQVIIPIDSVLPGGSVDYKVRLPDLQASLRLGGRFNITGISGGNATSIEVPFRINVDVIIPESVIVDPQRPVLDTSPSFLSQDVIIGRGFSDKILIRNLGKGKLGAFDIQLNGLPKEIVKVSLPTDDIESGGQRSISITINPTTEQKYIGSITITSNGGQREVGISLESFEDLSPNIDILESKANDRQSNITKDKIYTETEAKNLFAGVLSDISDAKTSWDAGKYRDAKNSYNLASGKLDQIVSLLASGKKTAGDGGGLLLPIIIVGVLAAVGLFAFKKFRKPVDYGDEEYAEGGGEEGEYPEEGGEGREEQ